MVNNTDVTSATAPCLVERHSPHALQFKGARWARTLMRWLGWSVHFEGLPSAQGVIVGYPHTSNWDFPIAMLAKASMGIPVNFLAKDSLFRIPVFGRWLRALGGVAVDRRGSLGVVGGLVETVRAHQAQERFFWLGISPEGTRRHTPGWRSGFYQLALQAKVPVGLAHIDWGRKRIALTEFIDLSGDPKVDYAYFARAYAQSRGYHAQQAAPIQPLPTTPQTTPPLATSAAPTPTPAIQENSRHG